ncbi:MAG: MXAN_6577-like cysteine-rich protein [Polyangiales bacterium]
MGALFEVLAPTNQRGTRFDLGLQRLRASTAVGRVRLAIPTISGGHAGVVREVEAPRDKLLDDRLAALGDQLVGVDIRAFVRLERIVRAVEGDAIGIISEYVEGRPGVAPQEPAARARAVRAAGATLLDALSSLSTKHGLAHGAIKPSNLLLGALGPSERPLPVRVFDLGVGAVARVITEYLAGDVKPSSLDGAFAPAEGVARLGGALLCTATTWGVPGYVPIGHFATAAPPTRGTDLFGALVSLWELLTGATLLALRATSDDAPWATRATRLALSADAALMAFVENPARRDGLRAALVAAMPGAHAGALGNWVDLFDASLARGASDPASLDADTLRTALSSLPDPHATATTLPVVTIEEPEDDDAQLPAVITLEPGREYRAEVVLDYFSGESDAGDRARTLRFRHVSMLGEGAMGSVHRVEIVRSGEAPLSAALKLAVDDSVHNRDALLREAHVLRAQRLDGMAQFLALVELPGRSLALLMSFQPGKALDKVLATRRLSSAEAMALGRRLLGTLVALHADVSPDDMTEVVHGDIKPGNVIVPMDAHDRPDFGAAVFIDFGVSRLRLRIATPPSTTSERGSSQVLGGTTGYMPLGHLQKGATPASDVFAVASVLYESLTGRMPWTVEGAERFSPFGLAFATEKLMRERDASPVSWREVPPWRRNLGWNAFFKKVLAHADPDRIPAAREALVALEGVRRDVSFPAAVALVALAAGALGTYWFNTAYCPQGQVRCDGACADLSHSEIHCGACGRRCAAGERCELGVCTLTCADGLSRCAGVCRDMQTDRANCGACGHACAAGEVCAAGRCAVSCGAGLTECNHVCRDTRTDRLACGRCGHACDAGQVCVRGACTVSCGAGLENCNGTCRDTRTDRLNCGGCGRVCEAGRVCSVSHCVTSCTEGLTDCAGSCRDTQIDRANCGACNRACAAGENCVAGRCRQECPPGLAICDGRCRDPMTDLAHCGACGRGCAAGERCEGGRCAVTCASGLSLCEGRCRDLARDEDHCGSCGVSLRTGAALRGRPLSGELRVGLQRVRRRRRRPVARRGPLRLVRAPLRPRPRVRGRALSGVVRRGPHRVRRPLPRPRDKRGELRRVRPRVRTRRAPRGIDLQDAPAPRDRADHAARRHRPQRARATRGPDHHRAHGHRRRKPHGHARHSVNPTSAARGPFL